MNKDVRKYTDMMQPEYSPQPQNQEMIDMVMVLQENDFYNQARAVEDEIREREAMGEVPDDFIAKRIKRLNKRIGTEYLDMPAQVLAIAQLLDECDEPTGEEELIQKNRDMTFMGVDSFIYQGERRLAMRFHDIDKHEQGYLAFFADISVLEVADPTESYGLREIIAEQAAAAKERVCRPDFFEAGYHKQQKSFHDISTVIKREFDRLCGEDGLIDISCTEYYELNEDDKFILSHRVDQSALLFEEQETLSGKIVDVVYVEPSLDYFQVFANTSDYIIGDGAPCLVMSPSEKESLYFIPLVAVTGAEMDESDIMGVEMDESDIIDDDEENL